jgi:hypothetical protein
MIEAGNMARGKGQRDNGTKANAMPTFVDVKLTPQQREAFLEADWVPEDCTKILMDFTSSGYRVGIAWSGEHQSYTVSLTCRDEESPNVGLCMTCFAGELLVAVGLAWYKHDYIAHGDWRSVAIPPAEAFG